LSFLEFKFAQIYLHSFCPSINIKITVRC